MSKHGAGPFGRLTGTPADDLVGSTPPTDEARATDQAVADAESDPEGLNDPADADEARAGEPRTEAGRALEHEIGGDYGEEIAAIESQVMSLECAAWLAEGYHRSEAAAAPAFDVERLAEAYDQVEGIGGEKRAGFWQRVAAEYARLSELADDR